ncbi:MAG: hypothetical protein J7M34_11805, partial [Anaerolineae bacterium]|nr:hypothetical protein [Anaerolineae bacterium]
MGDQGDNAGRTRPEKWRVGILHHPRKPASQPLAEEMAAVIQARGGEAWLASAWDEADVGRHLLGTNLIITLGGDGTMLRAARMGA